jgi:murein DD-endopeptidase MepM/ murein hydrolase activator NlpD
VAYKVFIKKNSRPVVRWVPDRPWYVRHKFSLSGLLCLGLVSHLLFSNMSIGNTESQVSKASGNNHSSPEPLAIHTPEPPLENIPVITAVPEIEKQKAIQWQTVTVAKNENLALIFDRQGLSPRTLFLVMASGRNTDMLKRLIPGDQLHFLIEEGNLKALRYEPDLTTLLDITRNGDGFSSNTIKTELEKRQTETAAVIQDSLFLAGQHAGLSDNIIMRLVGIYGWDIDFALDIRSGDSFKVIYEEQFKHDEKVGEGPIIAAEFINRGRIYRTLRYTAEDGHTGYYNEDGFSMRKAFLRTPVKFSRISSHFTTHRKHPVLNRIRAHKGVDYAAPTGTPIKATGDGTVSFAGTNGGYGKSVILKHGGVYNTVYAHMSRFARGIKRGKHVNQGDIIGFVGSTGLVTGPHLHYEFRVNGVHHNPLTVKLPKALRIPESGMAHFRLHTTPLLALLNLPSGTRLAAGHTPGSDPLMLALEDTNTTDTPVQ